MTERSVILIDFTTGTTGRISQAEAAARMLAQRERGVRMTCEGVPSWVYRWSEFGRWLRGRGYVG